MVGLTTGRAYAHRTRAPCARTSPDATLARPGARRPRQPRQPVHQRGGLPSFSRPGNPYDNAQTEAGWSTLKTELLPHGKAFVSFEEARLEVAHYLDTYFNLDRRHSALGYRSPRQFERDLKLNLS